MTEERRIEFIGREKGKKDGGLRQTAHQSTYRRRFLFFDTKMRGESDMGLWFVDARRRSRDLCAASYYL